MRVISDLIATGECLFPHSQIRVYVIWEVLSSLFSKFFQRFLRAISEDIGLDELRHTDNNK